MRLDRNLDSTGTGKYALLKLRRLHDASANLPLEVTAAIQLLNDHGLIEWGARGTRGEFFPIKLCDLYSLPGLRAYAKAAEEDGNAEYADDIYEMAGRSGVHSPFCKRPD